MKIQPAQAYKNCMQNNILGQHPVHVSQRIKVNSQLDVVQAKSTPAFQRCTMA